MRPAWLANENIAIPVIVLDLARAEGRWLVTFDRDYGELVFRRNLPPPPVILLFRVPFYTFHTSDFRSLVGAPPSARPASAPDARAIAARRRSYQRHGKPKNEIRWVYRADEPAESIESLHASGQLVAGNFHIFGGRTIRRRPFLAPATGSNDPA
jgi:hypothetical protein